MQHLHCRTNFSTQNAVNAFITLMKILMNLWTQFLMLRNPFFAKTATET